MQTSIGAEHYTLFVLKKAACFKIKINAEEKQRLGTRRNLATNVKIKKISLPH